jgi:hypothetical protein
MTFITRRHLILGGLAVAGRAQKTLLDATDFSGWQSFGSGVWTAEENEVVGRSSKNAPGPGYLFTRTTFQDFRLAMSFSISAGGRSGIYLREPLRKWTTEGDNRPGFGPGCGYEVRIDYQDRDHPTGTINNIQKPKKLVGSEEAWNELQIVCRGTEIRIFISGQIVNHCNQLRAQPGVIGFGVPGGVPEGFIVRFRDIAISSVE